MNSFKNGYYSFGKLLIYGAFNCIIWNCSVSHANKRGQKRRKCHQRKGVPKSLLYALFRYTWMHSEFANDLIAIRVESEKLRWTMENGTFWVRMRKKNAIVFTAQRLVGVCVCVHLMKITSIYLRMHTSIYFVCMWVQCACCTSDPNFNVPPNLFVIIYKMTTFIWHHDNGKFTCALQICDGNLCSCMNRVQCNSYIFPNYSLIFFFELVWEKVRLQLVFGKKRMFERKFKSLFLNLYFIWLSHIAVRTKLITILQLLWRHHFCSLSLFFYSQMLFSLIDRKFYLCNFQGIINSSLKWNFDSMKREMWREKNWNWMQKMLIEKNGFHFYS